MSKECGDATCSRDVVPGFNRCWWHADVEKMAAKIVDLTGQIGALQKERDDYFNQAEEAVSKAHKLMGERNWWMNEHRIATEQAAQLRMMLAELQCSIASALFGAARDDDRVPYEKIDGAMIDAVAPHGLVVPSIEGRPTGDELAATAEAFLAEEDRHGR